MKLIIEDDEGRKTVVPVVREEITIGRQDGNTIRLTERNVSRRHARFVKDNGFLCVEDLGSYNGVRVNGDRITELTKVKEGDLIEIGDYDLGVQGKLDASDTAKAEKKPRATETPKPVKKTKEEPAAAAPVTAELKVAAPEPESSHEAHTEEIVPTPAPPAAAPAPSGQSASAAGATAIIRLSDLAKPAAAAEVRDLAKSEMPRLVGLAGSFRGREFYLQRTEIKVGRTDDNDLGIDHQSISRQHCKFALEDGVWKVYDNKSANGVRLNGEDYAVTAVKPGDTLELGHVKFRFCAPGERFAPPPEEKPAGASAPAAAPMAPLAHAAPAQQARAAAPAGKSKTGLFVSIGVGVVVLAAVAFFALKGGGGGEGRGLSADAAIKEGDHAFAQHDYLEASRLYDQAAAKGTTPRNRKKAADEARAQALSQELDKAIASSDFDLAKAKLDALSPESELYYGKKGAEKADAVKAGYVKLHLGKASAAKGSNPGECAQQATLALQADSANEEAQSMLQACKGGAARPVTDRPERAVVERPSKPAAPAGPSPAERNAQAMKLAAEGNSLYSSRDFDGATEKYQAALRLKPSNAAAALCYRGLGIVAVQKKDNAGACQNFTAYLPLAPANEKARIQQLIGGFCK